MSDMFDNYPKERIPCNRRIRLPKDIITIMSGETTTHSFEVPMNVEKETIECKVIYKLGLDVVLEKTSKEDCDIQYDEHRMTSILTWKLSAGETMELFRDTLLDAKVQIRFVMNDGSIAFTDIMKIKLEDSLHSTTSPSPIIVNKGFGWTED